MWKLCLEWSADKTKVIARLPGDVDLDGELQQKEFPEHLATMGAKNAFVEQDDVMRFIKSARERSADAYEGMVVAQIRNAQVSIELVNNEMLANMIVVGAYGGRALRGPDIIHALAQARVSKGINKLALRKVLAVSHRLKPGEKFTQAVAVGKQAIKGEDALFTPLVEDITKRILKPKDSQSTSDKIDLRNLGETIVVDIGDELMRRTPPTEGTPGFTVQGVMIEPQPGKDALLKPGKGTEISDSDPNLLIATVSGTPLIKNKTIQVDNALFLNSVGVSTGHVKFKGNLIIGGNIESGMTVKATGSITVGGFIESANVQAMGDIQVAQGIIGHTSSEGQSKSCHVRSKGAIRARYAQYCELQSGTDIVLAVHSMNNDIKCGQNLTVLDANGKNGTLSGGEARVGGKVLCSQLGVEGDTATKVEAFALHAAYKARIGQLKEDYKQAQEQTMSVIRKELEFKKRPVAERNHDEYAEIESLKVQSSANLEETRNKLEQMEQEFRFAHEENVVEVKERIFARVTVQFADEHVTTKRAYPGSVFRFHQHEIKFSATLEEEDLVV